MAERTTAARPAAGVVLVGGSRDRATPWTAPHGQGAADGLHAVEETHAAGGTGIRRCAAVVCGIGGAGRLGAGRVRGRMGIRSRSNARAMKGVTPDWASLLRAWRES